MTKIGQYEILQEIGRGEMSTVYLAFDELADREVAVKVLCPPESFSGEAKQELRSRFLSQATATLGLSHPGIITTYYCHEPADEPEPFISMEYVAGQSLKARFGAERPEPGDVFAIVEAITEALHAAHRVGTFHGDVLPANIFVRRSDEAVKVGDFCIGPFSLSPPDAARSSNDAAAYRAPECLEGNPADARSDLFSLAVILYEGLCGTLPFQGTDAQSTMEAVLHRKPDPVTECVPGMPPSIDGFFLRALAKDPDHRFPDGMSFLEELQFVRKDCEASRQGVPLASMAPDAPEIVAMPEPEAQSEPDVDPAPEPPPGSGAETVAIPALIQQPAGSSRVVIERLMAKVDRRWLIPAGIAAVVGLSFLMGWLIRGGGGTDADAIPQRLLSSVDQSAREQAQTLTTTHDGDPRRWDLVGEPGTLDASALVELDPRAEPEPEPIQVTDDESDDESEEPIPVQVVQPLLKPAKKTTPPPSKVAPTAEPTRTAPEKVVAAPEPAPSPEPAPPRKEEAPGFLSQAVAEPVADTAPVPAPLQQSAAIATGDLAVEIRSSIKKGTLFLFLDDDTIFKQLLAAEGGVMKRMVKKGEGSLEHFEKKLELPPGEYKLHALVHRSGKTKEWRETLVLRVESGQSYSVVVKIGRMMGFGGGLSLSLESGADSEGL